MVARKVHGVRGSPRPPALQSSPEPPRIPKTPQAASRSGLCEDTGTTSLLSAVSEGAAGILWHRQSLLHTRSFEGSWKTVHFIP